MILDSEEFERLREENRQLRGVLGSGMRWPAEWRLSRTETIILGMLVSRETAVSTDALMTVLYSDRIEPPGSDNIIRVFVTALRRRLRPWGVTIRNIRDAGYYLAAEDRNMLRGAAIKSSSLSA